MNRLVWGKCAYRISLVMKHEVITSLAGLQIYNKLPKLLINPKSRKINTHSIKEINLNPINYSWLKGLNSNPTLLE